MSRLLTHARDNAIAYLALFVALGGTSYAAIKLPRNSRHDAAQGQRGHLVEGQEGIAARERLQDG
jgi:hypothetical protein